MYCNWPPAPTSTSSSTTWGNCKDAIGEWHDWQELVSIAQKVLDHGTRCGLVAELKGTAEHKYEHALALAHTLWKTYLRNSGAVKKGASAASAKIPSEPVWKAIATPAA